MFFLKIALRLPLSLMCLLVLVSAQIGSAQGPAASTPVQIRQVTQQQTLEPVRLMGEIQANETVLITASVTERIVKLHFDDGDQVTKGQLLAELDHSEELAELAEAESILKEAQQQLSRLRPLVDQGASPQSSLDTAVAQVQTAKAGMNAIMSRLEQRKIYAPFAGVLGMRLVSPGAIVDPGKTLVVLHDTDRLKLKVSVPSRLIGRLGQLKSIEIQENAESMPVPVKINVIDGEVQRTQTFYINGIVEPPFGGLVPGMRVPVTLWLDLGLGLVIPESSIVYRADQTSVFTVDADQTVVEKIVEIGLRYAGQIEVISGLERTDRVVSLGGQILTTGDRVHHVDL